MVHSTHKQPNAILSLFNVIFIVIVGFSSDYIVFFFVESVPMCAKKQRPYAKSFIILSHSTEIGLIWRIYGHICAIMTDVSMLVIWDEMCDSAILSKNQTLEIFWKSLRLLESTNATTQNTLTRKKKKE